MAGRSPTPLKAHALRWLAQREYSRDELRRKLLVVARRGGEATQQQGQSTSVGVVDGADTVAFDAEVDELLDWLAARNYLSETRFVESRIRAREERFGNLRIRRELAGHGLTLDAAAAQRLRETELERAMAVWARRFGKPPVDAAARARQARFLAGRGFPADVIRQVVDGRAVRDDD